MAVGTVNNWADLGVVGRVDVDELTVGGLPVTASNGTVTSASVVSANGLAGTVATATTTPAITLSTTVTGIVKGNGTALSAATSGTDYSAGTSALATGIVKSTTTTGDLSIAVAGDFPTLNQDTTGQARGILTGSVPASATATGVAGTMAWEAGFLYVCVATDTWERVATATWV